MITAAVPAYRGPIHALIAFPLRYTREAAEPLVPLLGRCLLLLLGIASWVSAAAAAATVDSGDSIPRADIATIV